MVYEKTGLKVEGQRSKEKKIGRGGKLYTPAEAGDGVAFEFEKIKPAVMSRIEALGLLNDRRLAYKGDGDWVSLLRLADEYEEKRMPVMAEAVRKEAYECEGFRCQGSGARRKRKGGGVGAKAAGDVHAGAGGSTAGGDADDVRQCGDPADGADVHGAVQRQGTSARVQRQQQRATGQAGGV